MARSSLVRSNFSSGVLDPRLASRVDITHYERGLQQGTNVVVTPYGGLRRRGGMRRVGIVTDQLSTYGTRVIPFMYNSNIDQYLLVFCVISLDGGGNEVPMGTAGATANAVIKFYKNDALITNINGSGKSFMGATFADTVFSKIRYAQTADTMVVVTSVNPPKTIVRGTADNLWTITTITFSSIPQIDFNDASSPTPTSEKQTMTFAATPGIGDTWNIDLEGVLTESITWAGDATADQQAANKENIRKALAKLYNTGPGDILVTRTGALVYTVEFQNGSARPYGLMTGFVVTGSLVVTIVRTTPGVARTEPLWSAGRGYPSVVTFWESRLVFGGFQSRPQSIAFSVTNDPYNFNTGEGLDDDAILRTLDTNAQNKIVAIVPSKHLQVFTQGAEFYFPSAPLTPGDSGVLPQTIYGSSTVTPVSLDGYTFFLEELGRGLRQFVFSNLEEAYQGPSASRLASHLLNTPVDMAATQSSQDDQGSYLYVVNTDGTVATMMSEKSEEVVGWTTFTTAGQVKNVAILTDQVYFLVRYSSTSGTARTVLAKLDPNYYTDDSSKATAASTVTWNIGSAEYNGISLQVRGDNTVLPNETPAANIITLANPVTGLEWGLGFNVTIQGMALALISQNFQGMNRVARCCRIYVRIKDTLGLYIGGYPMTDRYLDVTPLDTAPTALSGVLTVTVAGWGENVAPIFTQTDPLPLTLLSAEYELEMH